VHNAGLAGKASKRGAPKAVFGLKRGGWGLTVHALPLLAILFAFTLLSWDGSEEDIVRSRCESSNPDMPQRWHGVRGEFT